MKAERNHTLKIGEVIQKKWVILEFIAKGGMGEIYRAHQLNLKRDVALKIISRGWLKCIEDDDEEISRSILRFRREVESMAKISHPFVLQIFDYGNFYLDGKNSSEQIEYIVMEFIPGGTMRSTMSEDGFLDEEELICAWIGKYFLPVLEGIHSLHENGIIHRDLKPENVFLDGAGPKIADFGLVRSLNHKPFTCSIEVKGSIHYMPPEQFFDFSRVDQRGDIYALGKILYEAIVGKLTKKTNPFKQVTLPETNSLLFTKLNEVIQLATEEDPKDRIQSVTEFTDRLTSALKDKCKNSPSLPFGTDTPTIWEKGYSWRLALLATAMLIMTLHLHFRYDSKNEDQTRLQKSSNIIELGRPNVQLEENSVENFTVIDSVTAQSKDEMLLRLIPAGIFIPADKFGFPGGTEIKIESFYMDETQVTNHQYVEFLNGILKKVRVKNNVVAVDEEIWLLLGEVLEGYEPIVYRNGRFHISHSGHASCPVLRVTALGATAYANFYGKRMPTDIEWAYALQMANSKESIEGVRVERAEGFISENPNSLYPIPTPVIILPANGFGLRGMTRSIREWGHRELNIPTREKFWETEYLILDGRYYNGKESDIKAPVVRQPWEAFADVGFRCVVDLVKFLKTN